MPRAPKLVVGLLLALALLSPRGASGQRYDVTRYGAVAGATADPIANARAIQSALDTAYAELVAAGGTGHKPGLRADVFVPPEPAGFRVGLPLRLPRQGVGLAGSPGSNLVFTGGFGVWAGIAPVDASGQLTDASTILRGLVPGQRYAINLKDWSILLRGSPADLGPVPPYPASGPGFFDGTGALTIDLCLVKGPAFGLCNVFGSNWFNGPRPTPFMLRWLGTRYSLLLTTRDGTTTEILWTPDADPVQRVRLVIDFDGAKAQAHSGDVAVETTIRAGAGWKPGCRLARPRWGEASIPFTNFGQDGRSDYTLAGLKLIDRARYPVGVAVGTVATRDDGKPLNDLNSYVNVLPGDFFVLSLPTSPANDGVIRYDCCPTRSGTSVGYCPLVCTGGPKKWSTWDSSADNRVSDVMLHQQSDHRYGEAVLVGMALNLEVSGVRVNGFARGVDQVVWNTSYKTRIAESSFFNQSDCCISLDYGISVMERLFLHPDGRTLIRTRANEFRISDVMGADAKLESAAELLALSPKCEVDLAGADFEGNQVECHYLVSRGSNNGPSVLRFRDVGTGGVANGGVSVRTLPKSEAPGNDRFPSKIIIDNAFDELVNPRAAGVVKLDDPGFAVEVRGTPLNFGNPGQVPLLAPAPVPPVTP